MKKIRLELDELAVETFEPAATDAASRGTVKGAESGDGWNCVTRYGEWTCDGYFTCDRWIECPGTWVDNTCLGVNNCSDVYPC